MEVSFSFTLSLSFSFNLRCKTSPNRREWMILHRERFPNQNLDHEQLLYDNTWQWESVDLDMVPNEIFDNEQWLDDNWKALVSQSAAALLRAEGSSADSSSSVKSDEAALLGSEKPVLPVVRQLQQTETLTEQEIEYNNMLDGLGPRYEAWWGTGVLPVDADLLPPKVSGYMTPFRCLPTGMRPRLTNAEMTNLRKLAKSLPCHFALGRNRNHQGLAIAILKLWKQSLIVKIAVKRGIQNTNNKLMAEEINVSCRHYAAPFLAH